MLQQYLRQIGGKMTHNTTKKILTLFGTRPEVIKLAPVMAQLEHHCASFRTVNVASAQHTDLLYPFTRLFGIRLDHDLQIMAPGQTPDAVCARVLAALAPILRQEQPHLMLVQGDTTTALAGALAGFYQRIPVAHVEAGLRSGDMYSPYPEEMHRRLITRLATYHCAATFHNQQTLLAEGIDPARIALTGNPVVDAVKAIGQRATVTPPIAAVLQATSGLRRLVLTTHRRENFGTPLAENLQVLRRFIEQHNNVALVFPAHPNPAVVRPAQSILAGHPRIHLLPPLDYLDFIVLLSHAWLIVSDSGGVQEEAPSLGKPLLILRENTERPEAVHAGMAHLVGGGSERLHTLLEEASKDGSWVETVGQVRNPFGQGDSGRRIVHAMATWLGISGVA
jgi:UDP-N-acetylglucosamine 2-epimerase (non-hydrolysing)